jgi:phospholipid/cholesterol/gamma-HCH transport system substrate-binding protein
MRRHTSPIRRHQPRISTLAAGLIASVLILVVCYLVFGGSVPFTGSPFILKATFTAETDLHLNSPVRIAGVNVGQVTTVSRVPGSPTAAVVTMTIDPSGLPIHADATVNIRPRLFLEGNYYIDLAPGTPAAPTLSTDATLPAANTSGPVQLDRVLSALNSNARANLQTLLQGLGGSLNGIPTPAQDASQDPSQRGLTAGESLNASLKYAANAFKASAIVNQALLGSQPHDLSGVVAGNAHIFAALASQQSRLSDLVTVFNATMGALAARQQDLSTTIALLPPLLRAQASALGPLQSSFGPTRAFAQALTPSVKQLDSTIGVALPWIAQSTALLSPRYLGGLLDSLTPAVQGTASTLSSTETLLSGSDALARCLVHNVIPTGNEVIQDPPVSTGLQVYQELFQSAVGLAGIGQNFDGNGRYVRASAGGGSDRVATGSLASDGPLYGNAVLPPLGTRPAFPGQAPPVRRDIPCYRNAAPNLNHVRTGAGP